MIDIVGIPPFLIIALPVAMEIMHIHIGQTNLFVRTTLFRHLGAPNKQFGSHEKLSLGCKVGQISCWGNNYGILSQNKFFFLQRAITQIKLKVWHQF